VFGRAVREAPSLVKAGLRVKPLPLAVWEILFTAFEVFAFHGFDLDFQGVDPFGVWWIYSTFGPG